MVMVLGEYEKGRSLSVQVFAFASYVCEIPMANLLLPYTRYSCHCVASKACERFNDLILCSDQAPGFRNNSTVNAICMSNSAFASTIS